MRNVLLEWQSGALEPKDVLEWAEERYDLEELKDETVIEILTCLDSLHVNLTTVEDVPVFLQMLDLPFESHKEALALLERHDDSINLDERKEKYRTHPFYGVFCND
ncbi:MAG TPA: hypothetical protein VK308_11820 [Pyrinomonadaceae bacterium]|nr:hypothetical protein [Pyrinomonadaceae bacterium]